MPKSNPSSSPSINNDAVNKLSDVALRKKKNADAQAAFRARRANYIATLEETVTTLESVVLQLQESCRESQRDVNIFRNESAYLRYQYREREKFWRALCTAKKLSPEDLPPMPPLFYASAQPVPLPIPLNVHLNLQHDNHDHLSYNPTEDPVAICHGSYGGSSQQYRSHGPSLSYPTTMAGETTQSLGARLPKYHGYGYTLPTTGPGQTSHAPPFVEPDISYVPPFTVEEQKAPLSGLDAAPLVFPNSRSLSPTSTPGSASTSSLASNFPFTFSDNSSIRQDRTDLSHRRHSAPHGLDVTFQNESDIPLGGSPADAIRYRSGGKKLLATEGPILPGPPLIAADTCSPHDKTSNDENCSVYASSRLRNRRTVTSRLSRSPSPPPLSGTLAVIKAQAFGALRRTRARTKKASEGAAKVAMDVLEARGIGMGAAPPPKRPRLHDDTVELERS